MDTDAILDGARDVLAVVVQLAGMVPVQAWFAVLGSMGLLVLYVHARRSPRPSRVVIMFGTVIGLGWSAQGMWDTAVNTYGVPPVLASVLFCMFEAFFVGSMMEAVHYRSDLRRRGPWVRTVWTLAVVMALVVAIGEGWAQAPLRLSVPLVLALIWYRYLTADDDPDQRPVTTRRWTLHRLALAVGAIEAGERDAREINRDRLRQSMVRLSFRERYASRWFSTLTRTRIRRARLATDATDEDEAVVAERLARAARVLPPRVEAPAAPLAESEHVPAPEPISEPEPLAEPEPERAARRLQGQHRRDGRQLRGSQLKADAMQQVLDAERVGRPITNAELAALYDPPLRDRTAETFGAAARRLARQNGHAPV